MVAHIISTEGLVRGESTYLENMVVSGAAGVVTEDRLRIERRRELRRQREGKEENIF
ncbi:hypothetical protein PVK06_023469 [Gossypium arboreum]|uniref:Uncharacterized protein n=1 Tax=Gossypium arboreum TaxID=29729 RepID=A0ABR0PBE7_GOSAR|nr:hypothetical protein PVK06_023469 [Gossypium arboreum]